MRYDNCIAAMNSMTYAQKAQRALSRAAIHVKVVKLSPNMTKRGCAYGISFPCHLEANVKTVLADAGIRVREVIQEI